MSSFDIFTNEFVATLPPTAAERADTISEAAVTAFLLGEITVVAPRDHSSHQRGAEGEDAVHSWLQTMTGYTVTRTAGQKRSGDFIVSRMINGRPVRVLIDVKNYTQNVPSAETEKFHRDLECTGCDAGMLLSLRSGFSGQTGASVFGTLPAGTAPTLHLYTAERNHIIHAVEYLAGMAYATIEPRASDEAIAKLAEVRALIATFGQLRQTCRDARADIERTISRLADSIGLVQDRASMLLDQALRGMTAEK